MVHCEFCKKKSTTSKHLSFHLFPKDERRRSVWVRNMCRKNWTPKKFSVLCSAHFLPHCYEQKGTRMYLKPDSIPTIFEGLAVTSEAEPMEWMKTEQPESAADTEITPFIFVSVN